MTDTIVGSSRNRKITRHGSIGQIGYVHFLRSGTAQVGAQDTDTETRISAGK